MEETEKSVAEKISTLANEIHSGDLERRRSVVQEIYDLCYRSPELAKSAVPVLLQCLSDPDEKIGDSALWGLKYCTPESIEPLIDCLAHQLARVRERASHSLGNVGDEAAPACDALRKLLGDPVADVRKRAAWAIGLIHDTSERTIAALFQMSGSPNSSERSSAFHALGNIGKALVEPQLLRSKQREIMTALDDGDEDVRWSVAYLLESLDMEPSSHARLIAARLQMEASSRVREKFASQLKTLVLATDLSGYVPQMCHVVRQGGSEASVMCEVLAALGPKGESAIPDLVAALNGDGRLVIEAALAIWKIDRRVDKAVPALARVFDDNPEAVCDAVCEIGPAAAPLIPKLLQSLNSQDNWDLEWAAADAIGHIASDDPAILAVLGSSLGHPSPIVRSASARALARIGLPAVPLLCDILREHTDDRSEWAADALGRMGPVAADATALLRSNLRSKNAAIATWSAIALAKVAADASVVPSLIELLAKDRSDLRTEAALALQAIGPAASPALPALRAAMEDEDEEVRAAADGALNAISGVRH